MAKTTVPGAYIADNAVVSAKIASNAIEASHISGGAVVSVDIGDNSITISKIAANAVSTSEIAANAIGSSEIAANAVDSAEIVSGSIDTAHIADSQVTNAKLANSSVTVNSNSLSLGASLTLDTDDIGEGSSNLYHTTARVNSAFDTRLGTKDTGDLSEGSNLYHTTERVQDITGAQLVTNGSHTGISFSYDDANDGNDNHMKIKESDGAFCEIVLQIRGRTLPKPRFRASAYQFRLVGTMESDPLEARNKASLNSSSAIM